METIGLVQRRQLVVDPKSQYGLILKLIFMMSVILLVSITLYTILFNVFSNFALPVSVENGGVMYFGEIQSFTLSDEIQLAMAVLLLSTIIGGFGIYVYGVFITHRMAGPAYRLKGFIDEMNHGDLESKISLRDKDYFQFLATDINCLRQKWHDSILELENINKKLNEGATGEQKELLERSSKILSDLLRKVS